MQDKVHPQLAYKEQIKFLVYHSYCFAVSRTIILSVTPFLRLFYDSRLNNYNAISSLYGTLKYSSWNSFIFLTPPFRKLDELDDQN